MTGTLGRHRAACSGGGSGPVHRLVGKAAEIDDQSVVRAVEGLVIPRIGAVVCGSSEASGPWRLVDADGADIEHARRWLTDLHACGNSPATVRAYAYDLLNWLRFLDAIDVGWVRATRWEVRDWVRWHLANPNPQRRRGSRQANHRPTPGSVNEKTGKPYLTDAYARSTINRQLSAVSGFYEFALEADLGPLRNPVPKSRAELARDYAHTNPMDDRRRLRRAPYRQRVVQRVPRSLSDVLYEDVFTHLTNNRDRAIVATAVSGGLRASELLSMRRGLMHAADQTVEIVPKGGGGERVLARLSPAAFVWIARYLAERPPGPPDEPVWMALRGTPRPLTYWALRRVLERTNELIGTNVTMHDFRHTFCTRLAGDEHLTIGELQDLMRHASLSSTMIYLRPKVEDLIDKLDAHWNRPAAPPPVPAKGYAAEDLRVLFDGAS